MTTMTELPWLTIPEACAVLRVGQTRAYQRAKATGFLDTDRRIPVLRINGTYRVATSDLKLVATQSNGSTRSGTRDK